jgi:hypothetical protein
MATWRVNNATSLGGEVLSFWQANHAYSLGARCVATTGKGTTERSRVYECTTGGTSHATTEPTWDTTVGNTTADGTVTWTCRAPTDGSWDNATLFRYAFDLAADGDTIYVHDSHSETYEASINLTASSTVSSRVKIYCVEKTDNSLSTGAVFGTASASQGYNLDLKGSFYSYGVKYVSSGGVNFANGSYTHNHATLQHAGPGNSVIEVGNYNANSYLGGGNFNIGCVEVFDGDIKLAANTGFSFSDGVIFHWKNGVLIASGQVTNFNEGTGARVFEDVDLSAICTGATAKYFTKNNTYQYSNIVLLRCKLPSGSGFDWTNGTYPPPVSNASVPLIRAEHCSSGNNVIGAFYQHYFGEIYSETTIIKTDGASDGTTGFSWKMISNAYAHEDQTGAQLQSVAIGGWFPDADSQTLTVDCLIDSATNLQDDEVWMEVHYPANNTDGLGTTAHNRRAILGTPADVTTSSATWTTTGMSNPNEFKLSVTVDPGKVGPFEIRVYLAKPSTTIYVDPKVTIT